MTRNTHEIHDTYAMFQVELDIKMFGQMTDFQSGPSPGFEIEVRTSSMPEVTALIYQVSV